ncbi:MAG: hypothetical protein SPJ13_05060 [Bacteroidales bacterium]|nr:hypothetical protein [Bacteroidales bacterium]
MKKTITSLLMLAFSVMGWCQNGAWNKTYPHHFGLGVSTNMFDSWKTTNQFLEWTKFGNSLSSDQTLSFHVFQSTTFSLHGEYQYDLSDRFSIGARLQYHHRTLEYKFLANSDHGGGEAVHDNLQNHIELLPAFVSWHFASWGQFGLFANLGGGLNFNLDQNPIDAKISVSSNSSDDATFQLHKTVTITPIGYAALGYEFLFGNGHILATTLSFILNQSHYEYKFYQGQVGQKSTYPFKQNDLEIGLTYFF